MSIRVGDGTTDTNVDSTSHGLVVQNPKTLGQEGFADMSALIDAGTVTGSRLARAIMATPFGRAEVSQATPIFTDTFNYTAQDTGRWNVALTSLTMSYASGFMTLNASSITTANAVAVVKSYFTTPIPTEGSLRWRKFGYLTQTPQANCTVEFGMLYAVGTASPTDGVFFRFDSTGALKGVLCYNGTESATASITAPAAAVSHRWEIVLDEMHVEFWIDGVVQGTLNSPSGNGQPMMSSSVQNLFRMYHSASPPSLANQLKVSDVDLWSTDGNLNRPSAYERCQSGMSAYQGVSGMTMGQTTLYASSGNPGAAVPTHTSAALGSGLGGQFWETASLAVNTDGIISSFQVPAGTVNLGARKLVITGIRWQSMVQTILAGGPFVYMCGLAFGHTSVSLATAEGAAAKAPRLIPMGLYTLAATAPVGSQGANFSQTFASPIVVNSGEFIATIVKNIGTVGTSGTISHAITFDAHWE